MRPLQKLRNKHFDRWLPGWAEHLARRALSKAYAGPRHLVFAFCDHYEPLWGKVDEEQGTARVRAWHEGYPRLADAYRDADGHKPRHSFFFPGEQYRPHYLDDLADLARAGLGEVEVHLHHDGDTAATLQPQLLEALANYAKHGHLARDPDGRLRYAFIHGNWALANGRPDGRWCGVDAEVPLLFDTGCFADFTFPSAPDQCQPNIVNRIYWPTGDLAAKRCYERGEPARVGHVKRDRILLVQGPLSLSRRVGRMGIRIEGAEVRANDPPNAKRIATWIKQGIHVEGRPEWVFVKLHTHGAPDKEGAALLGPAGRALHDVLTTKYNDGKSWNLHYVTAREMFNIAIAAMEGRSGNPNDYRNHALKPPPIATA